MRQIVWAVLMLLFAGSALGADVTQLSSAADQAYSAKQWPQATELYLQLTKADPPNAFWWLRLGECYRRTAQYDGARAALEKAAALGY